MKKQGNEMIFYEIELQSIPQIKFSLDVSMDNYQVKFENYPDFLELTIVLEGRTVRSYNDGTLTYCDPGMFVTINQLSNFSITALNNEHQRHITVGVNVKHSCVKRDSEICYDIERIKKGLLEKRLILIPDMVFLKEQHEEIANRITKIIRSFSSNDPRRSTYSLAHWFHLTSLLTEYVLNEIEKTANELPPSAMNYVEQAKRYIEKHYTRKIYVKDIAQTLNISEGDLFDIFKKATGMSVLDYINHYRVNIVKQYVSTYNLSLCEAALQVGIEDPAYMSRLFKKLTGISYREFISKRETT